MERGWRNADRTQSTTDRATMWLVLLLLAFGHSPAEAIQNADAVPNVAQHPRDLVGRQARRASCSSVDGGIDMCNYLSHDQMAGKLRELERRFPSLAQVGVIGKSVRGRDLLYIKVTRGAAYPREVGKPMFKYVANIHGDEAVGRQLMIYLAEYLLNGYGRDQRVSRLVNDTEIYLMPSMNPDGNADATEGCSSGVGLFLGSIFGKVSGRENANSVDLNRDFPRQFDEDQSKDFSLLLRGRQPETAAVMKWIKSQPFVLSANMHAGAVVASYPFDDSPKHKNGFYSVAPDDKYFKYAAGTYSSAHSFMSKGNSCGDRFPGGTTNGAAWYDVPGGMQDFNYIHSNCMEITLELTCCKYPPSSTLASEWFNNKEALLRYMEIVHIGAKGLVVDKRTQTPIPNARVRVRGIEKDMITTDRGEYWRLLAPGSYDVYVEADGYHKSSSVSVNVADGQPIAQLVTFQLERL